MSGHLLVGTVYRIQGKLDDALSKFKEVVDIDSEYAIGYYNIAGVYSLKNELKLAIEYLQKAIDLDENLVELPKMTPIFDNIRQTPEYQQLINSK